MNHSETNDDKNDGRIPAIKLGLKANINQFLLLILVNAFVGAMIGLEQTVVPLLGKEEFGLESNVLILSFIASFGIVKAILNLFAGSLSDRWNRKKVLVLGWLFAVPVPFILLYGLDWNWVLFANVLLGVNQGLAWSMIVNMKIDLVGKERRGLALGLNEFAGYVSVALVGFFTGYIAATYGLEPYPLYLGIAFSLLGLIVSLVFVKDTSKFTELELRNELELEKEDGKVKGQNKDKEDLQKRQESTEKDPHFISGPYQSAESNLNFKQIFLETSWKNRSLLAASQAGLVNNLIFGVIVVVSAVEFFTVEFIEVNASLAIDSEVKAINNSRSLMVPATNSSYSVKLPLDMWSLPQDILVFEVLLELGLMPHVQPPAI